MQSIDSATKIEVEGDKVMVRSAKSKGKFPHVTFQADVENNSIWVSLSANGRTKVYYENEPEGFNSKSITKLAQY